MFEFGCFPGRYMAHLGKKGMTVNGMDLAPNLDDRFIAWMKSEGIATGLLKREDVLAYAKTTDDRYDMVCSFGFIEHFRNFPEIIALHDRILKPGGLLMITTPNFRGGLQQFLHRSLDKVNMDLHYLPSMKPDLWQRQLVQEGYERIFAGYFGRFDFWCDEQPRNALQKIGKKITYNMIPALRLLPDSAFNSPYCGIVLKKSAQ